MNHGRYVFTQLMDLVPRYEFNKCTNRYKGNSRVRKFSCWQHFLCLSFGQVTFRESLRDIVVCLQSRERQLYHFGFRTAVTRSTWADANRQRNWRIYCDFAQVLMARARQRYQGMPHKGPDIDHTVYALDASLVHLCLNVFPWTKYRQTTAAVKMHSLLDIHHGIPEFFCVTDGLTHDMAILKQLFFEPGAFYVMDRGYMDFAQLYRIERSGAFFVIRAKSSLRFKRQYSRPKSGQQDIVCDQIGELVVHGSRKAYPVKLRRIKAKDPETGKATVLLTNHMEMEAQKVLLLYRSRWKMEIFFRWIKQHLGIKLFWGERECRQIADSGRHCHLPDCCNCHLPLSNSTKNARYAKNPERLCFLQSTYKSTV
ncbi:IS4 family transposase [Maribacter sp. 2307ULW6-5]|uniref:IS4 family transposase n=1 Tax=Maribacter sp. 2307ULW6-5 TaxID=3386275 RepID=UPI0039BD271A